MGCRILYVLRRGFYPVNLTGGAVRSAHRILACLAKDHGAACMALSSINERQKMPARRARAALGIRSVERKGTRYEVDCGYPIRFVRGDFDAALDEAIAEFAPTVIWAESNQAFKTLAAGWKRGVPGVLFFRDAKNALPARHVRAAAEKGTRFLCNSDFTQRWVRESYGIEPPVVWPLIDPERYRVAWDAEGALTMVNPHPLKGISTFLKIARALPSERFLLVEGWPLAAEMRRALKRGLSLLPNVRFIRRVPDIREVLKQTRILLVPSLWQEPSARVILEAQVSGIPVLASRVGGLPTWVGKGGVLIEDYRDPEAWIATLRSLFGSPRRLRALSRAAIRNSKRPEFSERAIVRRFLEAIGGSTEKRPRP